MTGILKRIMHIEDDRSIQEVARVALEVVGGFEVRSCDSGTEGLAAVADFSPQLVLLDVMMPKMDGLEALRRLREDGNEIPVIVMSGHGTIETTQSAEEAWDEQIQRIANKTLYPRTNSWYLGANIPGKPRQFLGHLAGSQYFDQLTATADGGFEAFVFEPAVAET